MGIYKGRLRVKIEVIGLVDKRRLAYYTYALQLISASCTPVLIKRIIPLVLYHSSSNHLAQFIIKSQSTSHSFNFIQIINIDYERWHIIYVVCLLYVYYFILEFLLFFLIYGSVMLSIQAHCISACKLIYIRIINLHQQVIHYRRLFDTRSYSKETGLNSQPLEYNALIRNICL